jgi:3-phenylpropionate/trans-cinnamate dioxygenase ferredoxin component
MDEFITVCNIDDVSSAGIRAFDLDDVTVAIANVDGALYAVNDACSHRGCPLSEGELDGTSVVCRCHFGRFDLATGKPIGGPPKDPIDIFEIRIMDDQVQVRPPSA